MSIVDDLIPHMRRVQSAERDLRDLGLVWQMIEASAAISCPVEAETILPMLTQTRVRFAALQARLVEQLGQESLAELHDELSSTAQCTIDILVRNLYERTADVGFLATDDDLRAFCAAGDAERAALRPAFARRLAEYRAKYTVYDDIVLLAPDGQVLVRLDAAAALARSADAIVADAVAKPGCVERFGPSDLGTGAAPALLYGHRVDDAGGRCIGVLVLRFRQADEMQRIFDSVLDPQRQVALVLLDDRDRVIASNDEAHVPLGALVRTGGGGEVGLTVFAGREYLSVTRATHGYQGYRGPAGWRAHAMVSLLTAFRTRHEGVQAFESLSLDNPELARIQTEVDAINAELRRVVWNGRLLAHTREGAQASLKAVLRQINDAGTRTRDRVAGAIRDLYRTSFGRARYQASELARLAADIMDRNLYERANDCRWWALSPVLRRVLEAPPDPAGTAELESVLAHVNGLYTVYVRLVAFDAEGLIRAVSNERADAPLRGRRVDATLLQATLALADSQRYAVTPFVASDLSDGVPSYVFAGAVRGGAGGRPVGGIAIVFDAEREFRAMLDEVLGGRRGLAAFVDGDGRVLACTDAALPAGSRLPFAGSGIVEYGAANHVVARTAAGGYREFKRSDGYANGVQAVIALHLGGIERRRSALSEMVLQPLATAQRGQAREFAMFQIGPGRYALPAELVIEARHKDGLVRAPTGVPHALGLLDVPYQRGSRVIPVLCGRRLFGLDYPARAGDGVVLVLGSHQQPGRPLVGLQVDDLSSVLDVGPEHLQPMPRGLGGDGPALAGLLRLGSAADPAARVLVQLLQGESLLRSVTTAVEPAPA